MAEENQWGKEMDVIQILMMKLPQIKTRGMSSHLCHLDSVSTFEKLLWIQKGKFIGCDDTQGQMRHNIEFMRRK